MRKVFEIGHGKTGSTSLFHAMKRLGFTACHWPIPGSRDWLPKLLLGEDFRFDFLDGHEFSGNGLERFYRHLDRLYPDAKFILTVRDESDWLRSYQRHLQGTRNLHQPVHFYAYMLSSYGAGNFDSDLWLRAYRNHNSEVQEYFKDRPEKLLVMNVCSGDGYEKLCPFLNLPVLSEPFPRKNASENPTAARPPIAAQKPSLRSVPASASKYQGLKEWGWYLDDLQQWKSLLGRMEPTKALEIGAFDGISANLMLDELFPNPQSEIHCIDPFLPDPTTPQVNENIRELFLENIRRGRHEHQVHLYEGLSGEVLGWMISTDGFWESFDFIYVDGSHLARHVLIDAALAWNLLKVGGIIVFDDYEWGEATDRFGRPGPAIDAFEGAFADRIQAVMDGYRKAYRKLQP